MLEAFLRSGMPGHEKKAMLDSVVGARHLRNLVDEGGTFGVRMVKENG